MAFSRPWDNAVPADTQAANLLGQNIRRDKEDTAERLRAFGSGLIASRETPEADFGNASIGVLFYAEDEDKLYRWNGTAWNLVKDFGSAIVSLGGAYLDPTGARNLVIWRAPFAVTVTNVRGYRVGGTGATINARLNGTDNHLVSDLSLTSAATWQDGGAVQNTAYVAGDKLELMLVTVAGNPTEISIQVDFTKP